MRRFALIEAPAGHALEVAHGIVGGVPHEAARERYAGYFWVGTGCARQRRTQHIQELLLGARSRRMHAADIHARRFHPHLETVAEADEGIARQPLASLDAF